MKKFLTKTRNLFTRLLTKSKLIDLDVCVAERVKASELFFISYQSGENILDLWNFDEDSEEEFAAILAFYFTDGKACEIIENSLNKPNDIGGDPNKVAEYYFAINADLIKAKEIFRQEGFAIGVEPPVVSPLNIYKPRMEAK